MKHDHFFNILHSLSFALSRHNAGNVNDAREFMRIVIVDAGNYLKENTERRNADKWEDYRSEESGRPEHYLTVLEYLVTYSPETLDLMDDLAIETSAYGIKASRKCKEEGITPYSVPKPAIFADDDHFETVKAYPFHILYAVIHN